MPNYKLNAGTSSIATEPCGEVIVSMSGGSVEIRHHISPGHSTIIPGAAYTNRGGGTAMHPKPGDTLYLNGLQVTPVAGGTTYMFRGNGTFLDANHVTHAKKGYYHWEEKERTAGDWDCADE